MSTGKIKVGLSGKIFKAATALVLCAVCAAAVYTVLDRGGFLKDEIEREIEKKTE